MLNKSLQQDNIKPTKKLFTPLLKENKSNFLTGILYGNILALYSNKTDSMSHIIHQNYFQRQISEEGGRGRE